MAVIANTQPVQSLEFSGERLHSAVAGLDIAVQCLQNVQGDGLYQFADEKFRAFDPGGKRLRDNNIGCFTFTPSGKLFIMHDLGIDVYNIKTNLVHRITLQSFVCMTSLMLTHTYP